MNMTAPGTSWRGEIGGGMNATAAMLPFVLSYGFIVYGSAGAATVQTGLTGAVVAVIMGSLLMTVFSRMSMPTVAPSASTSLILGTLVLGLQVDPAMQPGTPEGLARLVAAVSTTSMTAGLLMVVMGVLRMGSLVRYVPQPVLAGFMNGIAVLILWSQLPALMGISGSEWTRLGVVAVAQWQAPALVIGVVTAFAVGLIAWRLPAAPAPMLALIAATAAVVVWQAWSPSLVLDNLARVGNVAPHLLPWPDALAPWWGSQMAALVPHQSAMLTTAVLLALVGGLESVLALAAVDPLLERRSDPDRSLIEVGCVNFVLSLFGGLFVIYLRLRALSTLSGGGRSPRAVLVSSLMLAAVFSAGLPLLGAIPLAVIGGIVAMLAWTLVDRWSRQLVGQWWRGDRSQDQVWSLLIVATVSAVTIVWGFVAGVGVGVLLAMVIFIRALQRSLVRHRYRASEIPSRRIYPQALENTLAPRRSAIEVFELEGALFFGNAQQLQDEAEAATTPDSLLRHLVIDLRRVNTLDASGAMALARLADVLRRRGLRLHLASVTLENRHGRALNAHGLRPDDSRWQIHVDADRAIEAAEHDELTLARQPPLDHAVALRDADLLHGLPPEAAARVAALSTERQLAAGEQLFGEGDPGDALYLLTRGSISVVDRSRTQRYVSFSPGMCFGETAVLDGQGRSAAAVADTDSVVHRLAAEGLQALQREDPDSAAQVYRNLAQHLSQRLRSAAAAWQRAAA